MIVSRDIKYIVLSRAPGADDIPETAGIIWAKASETNRELYMSGPNPSGQTDYNFQRLSTIDQASVNIEELDTIVSRYLESRTEANPYNYYFAVTSAGSNDSDNLSNIRTAVLPDTFTTRALDLSANNLGLSITDLNARLARHLSALSAESVLLLFTSVSVNGSNQLVIGYTLNGVAATKTYSRLEMYRIKKHIFLINGLTESSVFGSRQDQINRILLITYAEVATMYMNNQNSFHSGPIDLFREFDPVNASRKTGTVSGIPIVPVRTQLDPNIDFASELQGFIEYRAGNAPGHAVIGLIFNHHFGTIDDDGNLVDSNVETLTRYLSAEVRGTLRWRETPLATKSGSVDFQPILKILRRFNPGVPDNQLITLDDFLGFSAYITFFYFPITGGDPAFPIKIHADGNLNTRGNRNTLYANCHEMTQTTFSFIDSDRAKLFMRQLANRISSVNSLPPGEAVTNADLDIERQARINADAAIQATVPDVADWTLENNPDEIPDAKISSEIARDTEVSDRVDAERDLRIEADSELGDMIPDVSDWTLSDNVDTIPDDKIDSSITRDSELDTRVNAERDARTTDITSTQAMIPSIENWAFLGNSNPIPSEKLTLSQKTAMFFEDNSLVLNLRIGDGLELTETVLGSAVLSSTDSEPPIGEQQQEVPRYEIIPDTSGQSSNADFTLAVGAVWDATAVREEVHADADRISLRISGIKRAAGIPNIAVYTGQTGTTGYGSEGISSNNPYRIAEDVAIGDSFTTIININQDAFYNEGADQEYYQVALINSSGDPVEFDSFVFTFHQERLSTGDRYPSENILAEQRRFLPTLNLVQLIPFSKDVSSHHLEINVLISISNVGRRHLTFKLPPDRSFSSHENLEFAQADSYTLTIDQNRNLQAIYGNYYGNNTTVFEDKIGVIIINLVTPPNLRHVVEGIAITVIKNENGAIPDQSFTRIERVSRVPNQAPIA